MCIWGGLGCIDDWHALVSPRLVVYSIIVNIILFIWFTIGWTGGMWTGGAGTDKANEHILGKSDETWVCIGIGIVVVI